jgi:LmbE family N-acetylglucosaminyl deacetylase
MSTFDVTDSVLIVAAHPDDEILGCGATAAILARTRPVYIHILGEGATSRADQRDEGKFAPAVSRLSKEAETAARIIGASGITFSALPDNRFDSLALLDVVKTVEKVIHEIQPKEIFTHHGGDLNIDHQITFRAVLTATRPMQGQGVKDIYSFEIPSSTEWAFQCFEPAFRPNVFVDVTEAIETKIEALATYADEVRAFPHPRSADGLRALSRRWGTVAGVEAAEAFELIRSVR